MAGQYDNMQPLGAGSMQEYTPQSVVHTNFDVNPQLAKAREEALLYLDKREYDVIGGPTLDAKKLCIVMNEVLFADMYQKRSEPRAATAAQVQVFSSFNGIGYKKGTSDRAFRNRYRHVGIAQAQFDPEHINPSFSGVSGHVSGSITIHNNGTHRFFMGDVVGVRPPYMDLKRRKHQYEATPFAMPGGPGSFGDKRVGVIEKISYKDVVGEFNEVAMYMIQHHAQLNIPDFRRRVANKDLDTFSQHQILATMLKQQKALDILSGVHVLVNLGYLTPTMGPNVDLAVPNEASAWDSERLRTVGSSKFAAGKTLASRANEYAWTADTSNGKAIGRFTQLSEAEEIDRKKCYKNWVRFLSTRLGLLERDQGDMATVNAGGEDPLIALHAGMASLYGCLSPGLRQKPAVVKFLHDSLALDSFNPRSIGSMDFQQIVNQTSSELRRIHNDTAPLYARFHGELYNQLSQGVLGIALTNALSNQVMHTFITC